MAFIGFCLTASALAAEVDAAKKLQLAIPYKFCQYGLPLLSLDDELYQEKSDKCCEQHNLGCDNVAFDVSDCYEKDVNYEVSDADELFEHFPSWDIDECVASCKEFKGCKFFSYYNVSCKLKASEGKKVPAAGFTSSSMTCEKKGTEEAPKKFAELTQPKEQVEEPVEGEAEGDWWQGLKNVVKGVFSGHISEGEEKKDGDETVEESAAVEKLAEEGEEEVAEGEGDAEAQELLQDAVEHFQDAAGNAVDLVFGVAEDEDAPVLEEINSVGVSGGNANSLKSDPSGAPAALKLSALLYFALV